MTIVFEMSTDTDIQQTELHKDWPAVSARYAWHAVSRTGLNVADRSVIVVLAHGNNQLIGDAGPDISIDAETFLALVQGNMVNDGAPAAVYISACAQDIAGFSAAVRLCAQANAIWANTRIFGHDSPIAGVVPPPGLKGSTWVEIYAGRTR